MTADDVARVRRWECEQGGHDFNITQAWQSLDPHAIICARCGESWSIANGTAPDRPPWRLDLYEAQRSEPIGHIDGDGLVHLPEPHPLILFAVVPTNLHLKAGIMVAPLSQGGIGTGPLQSEPPETTQ